MLYEVITRVSDYLKDISSAISELSGINTQVAAASEEQNHVTADINRNLSTIYELVSQNVAGITQSAAASVITSYSIHYTKLYEEVLLPLL